MIEPSSGRVTRLAEITPGGIAGVVGIFSIFSIFSIAALSLGAGLEAQAQFDHTLAFAIGDTQIEVTVQITGIQGASIELRGLRQQRGKPAIVFTAAAGDANLQVDVPGGGDLGERRHRIRTEGARSITLRYRLPLVERNLLNGLGPRVPHRYPGKATTEDGVKVEAKPQIVRYHEAIALRHRVCFLDAVDGEATHRIRFALPAKFQIATTLARQSDGSFRPPGGESLDRSITYIGDVETLQLEIGGRPHRVVLGGFRRDRVKREEFTARLSKILAANIQASGPLKYESYTFFIGHRGISPTSVGMPRCAEITSHSLRESESFSRGLARAHRQSWLIDHLVAKPSKDGVIAARNAWFTLGAVAYQTEIALVRAGLTTPKRFWSQTVSGRVRRLQHDARRLQISVAETGVRMNAASAPRRLPGPHPRDRGFVIALVIDVELRHASGGKLGIDDVMRIVCSRPGFTSADIEKACSASAGRSFAGFFARHVNGSTDLPLTDVMAKIGIDARPIKLKRPKPTKVKRPPRWRVKIDKTASEKALALRASMTRAVD